MSKRAEIAALKAYPKSDFNGVETRRKRQRKCFIQGYDQAEKDMIDRIRKQVKQWMPEKDGEEHTYGERLAFNSVLHLLEEMEEE